MVLSILAIVTVLMPQLSPGNGDKNGVMTGAEVLIREHLDELSGKRVGLVMNPTARIDGGHMVDTLLALGVEVTALFAPEHGFRGESGAGEHIEDGRDRASGLPVYSLYGSVKKPTAPMLKEIDLLLFDKQDVGARFYTYNVTLGRVLEAAAENDIPVWVLDRPNPAGGDYVAGWLLKDRYQSFVGAYPIPMVHGMTLGELARMMVEERWIQFDRKPALKVVAMRGWERSMKWPETGLEWHPPSPNLPTFEHAFIYLGTVLFEGTTVSEGRGTEHPFLTVGSPSLKLGREQLQELREQFPSLALEPISFRPESIPGKARNPKFEREWCRGVRISVTNYTDTDPVRFGLELLGAVLEADENGAMTDFIYLLSGSENINTLQAGWDSEVEAFRKDRAPYLLY